MKWIFILQKNLDGLVVKSYDYHITKVFARLTYRRIQLQVNTLLTTYYVYIFGMYVYKNQAVKMNIKFFEQDCEIRFRDTLNCDLTIPQVISLIGQGVAQKYHIFCSEIFNFQFTIFLTTLQCK